MNVASGGRLDILLVFLKQKQEFIIHENKKVIVYIIIHNLTSSTKEELRRETVD